MTMLKVIGAPNKKGGKPEFFWKKNPHQLGTKGLQRGVKEGRTSEYAARGLWEAPGPERAPLPPMMQRRIARAFAEGWDPGCFELYMFPDLFAFENFQSVQCDDKCWRYWFLFYFGLFTQQKNLRRKVSNKPDDDAAVGFSADLLQLGLHRPSAKHTSDPRLCYRLISCFPTTTRWRSNISVGWFFENL